MKLAYSLLLHDSKVNMKAYRGEVKESLEKIKNIGYDGVELFTRKPSELNIIELTRILKDIELDVCSIGTAPILKEDKVSLCDPLFEIRNEAINRTIELIDFAAIFGATVNIGKFRGNLPAENRVEGWKWLREAIIKICEYAERKNVLIAIEPQNKTSINNINSTQEAKMWVENMDIKNLYILLDTYHMDISEKSFTESIFEADKLIKHIHIADSERKVPGQGNIDFPEIIMALRKIGYDGYLSLEIDQGEDGLKKAETSWRYLKSIIKN